MTRFVAGHSAPTIAAVNAHSSLATMMRSSFSNLIAVCCCVISSWIGDECFAANETEPFVPDKVTDSLFTVQTNRYVSADGVEADLRYRLYVPKGAESNSASTEQWPLLVWLHGFGQAGDDNRAHIRWLEFVVQEGGDSFPGFVVAYQCPYRYRTWTEGPPDEQPLTIAKAIIDELLDSRPIDPTRIYLSGVSSGGSAVWEMLLRHPDLFAAAVPLASGGSASVDLVPIAKVPIWAFHTREDPGTPIEGVRITVARLQAVGGKAYLTETPGYGHDCWTIAFTEFRFLDWLLSQEKGVDAPRPNLTNRKVELQMARQWIAAHGPQYYLVVPVAIIVGWWLAKKQWRARKSKHNDPAPSIQSASADGFTIVELLVVIAIIGVLVALLLPAVQMARESSRRSSCANNLRQQAVAVKLHEQTHKTFPTGGWGGDWLGDPDAGYSPKQPGGWIYNILSFIEEDNLRQLGRGLQGAPKEQAMTTLMQTPIEILYCPSRRLARTYPYNSGPLKNANPPKVVAKTDYAISATISFERSEVIMPDIQLHGKGAGKTVLAGEKSLPSDAYDSGTASGDKLVAYVGDSEDIRRSPTGPPSSDRAGATGFGGPHPGGANIAYCDGSVRFVNDDQEVEP